MSAGFGGRAAALGKGRPDRAPAFPPRPAGAAPFGDAYADPYADFLTSAVLIGPKLDAPSELSPPSSVFCPSPSCSRRLCFL